MGKIAKEVVQLAAVQAATAQAAERLAGITRRLAVPHGNLIARVGYEPVKGPDWCVYFTSYDERGRGFAASLEMGHINVPRGGHWTKGIRVLRDACREAGI